MKKISLKLQLILVTIVSILFAFCFIILVLPNLLKPFYEKNIYEILEQPLQYINSNRTDISGETAYLICDFTGKVYVSNNFNKVLKNVNISEVMNNITKEYGKFKIDGNTYYYNTNIYSGQYFVTICGNQYILEQEATLNRIVIPSILIITVIVIAILLLYSNFIVKKISGIKRKIDNIDNDNFKHDVEFNIDDELNSLVKSIEKTRISLKEKEQYKNNMFQTMSHELKTPIMVISSHIEAAEDNVIEKDKALEIIKKETDNLSKKVSLMLQLNKINYLKSSDKIDNKEIDLKPIIDNIVNKLKISKKELKYTVEIEEGIKFNGNEENWNIIFTNILINFIRYANKEIKIIVKKDYIELYNDGDKIEENLLDKIFETYTMGQNGKTGLGLAIVKQTLDLYGYKITVENMENGVRFVISK